MAVVTTALCSCLATPPLPAKALHTATATASPTLSPSATPTPPPATPTPFPPTLAIPAAFAAGNAARLAALQQAQPDLRIEHVAGAEAALARTQDGLATWAVTHNAPAASLPLCLTPYVPIVHFGSPLDRMSNARLRTIYQGNDWQGPVYYSGDPAILQRVLGVNVLGRWAVALPSWQAVVERVAGDRSALALVPWAEVDARVKTLPLDGKSIASDGMNGYSYGDAWRLASSPAAPAALQAAIAQKLSCPVSEPVTFMATGDILMGWYVHEAYLKIEGPLYPFRRVRDVLRSADITFADFENPMPTTGSMDITGFAFRASTDAVKGLVDAGIDVVNLANNHMGDYGPTAISDTLSILRRGGIGYVGAGRNRAEARSPWITTTKGITIALLGYNEIFPDAYVASDSQPGTAWIEIDNVLAEIKAAKARYGLVIASFHWGTEYTVHPTPRQQDIAHRAAEAGAALIIGDHPHVVQAVGFIGSSFVTYSLGDFVYSQPGSPATGEALILRAVIDGTSVKQIDLMPVYIDRAQPAVISAIEAKLMMARIFDAARLIGSLTASSEQPAATPALVVLPAPATATHGMIAAVALDGANADIAVWSAPGATVAGSLPSKITMDGMLNDAPVWSPDGRYIAYSSARSGNVDIYVAAADGSGAANISNNPAWDDYPTWSPDGSKLAFSSNRDGPFKIYVINVDGTGVRRLTDGTAWDTTPAWSPDGKRIAFASDRSWRFQIFTINSDGTGLRGLTVHPHSSYFPSWSPDGSMLAFHTFQDQSVFQDDDSNQDRDYELFIANTDGSGLRQLTSNRFADIQPAWSPDGKRVAFASDRSGRFQIYSMDIDGKDVVAVSAGAGAFVAPRWTP